MVLVDHQPNEANLLGILIFIKVATKQLASQTWVEIGVREGQAHGGEFFSLGFGKFCIGHFGEIVHVHPKASLTSVMGTERFRSQELGDDADKLLGLLDRRHMPTLLHDHQLRALDVLMINLGTIHGHNGILPAPDNQRRQAQAA
jgi:hypothetical protein